jgi:hypothetical protein
LCPLIPHSELKDGINDTIQDSLDLDAQSWQARMTTGGRIGKLGSFQSLGLMICSKTQDSIISSLQTSIELTIAWQTESV